MADIATFVSEAPTDHPFDHQSHHHIRVAGEYTKEDMTTTATVPKRTGRRQKIERYTDGSKYRAAARIPTPRLRTGPEHGGADRDWAARQACGTRRPSANHKNCKTCTKEKGVAQQPKASFLIADCIIACNQMSKQVPNNFSQNQKSLPLEARGLWQSPQTPL